MKKLALLGGEPYKKSSFHGWPVHDDSEVKNISKTLESEKWSRSGYFETKFSNNFAKYQGGEYAVCVTSGMVALFCALKALGVNKGDEVILPAFPQPTALSLGYVGAIPIFVDIEESSLCIDPQKIKDLITNNTKAIIVIHTHDTMTDMDKILDISREYNIPVIEDCAHAHGMKWNDKGAGYLGDIGIFSFESSKVMTSGEGGIVTTNNKKYYERIIALKNLGNNSKGEKQDDVIGWNFRMSEFHAAILTAQLDRFPVQVKKKYNNMRLLDKLLNSIDGISVIEHHPNISNHTGFLYSVIYDSQKCNSIALKYISKALKAEGLPIRLRNLSYNSKEVSKYLKSLNISPSCPIANHYTKNKLLTLPHHIFLGNESDIYDIYEIFKKVILNSKELKGFSYRNFGSYPKKIGIKLRKSLLNNT